MRGYYSEADEIEKPKKKAYVHEEYYGMGEHEQPELHIYQAKEGGDFVVWLNTGTADHDGLCIGSGPTRHEAIRDAVAVLEWAEGILQGPPPMFRMPTRRIVDNN
jgi:hypothetical protein